MPRLALDRKPPASVLIRGRSWDVQVVPGLRASERIHGDCEASTQTIRIAEDQTHQDGQDTLLHEVIHAIDYTLPEEQVTRLATDLIALFRANPKFVEFILK